MKPSQDCLGIPQHQNPARSQVWVYSLVNDGSINTSVLYWGQSWPQKGTDITYLRSSTLGDSFVINTDGVYTITLQDNLSSGINMNITKNSRTLSATVSNTASDFRGDPVLLAVVDSPANGCHIETTSFCYAGDVIRGQTDSAAIISNGNTGQFFRIVRIA